MKNILFILFLIIIAIFIGCEQDKDPSYRIQNNLDFDNSFRVQRFQGVSSNVVVDSLLISSETATDYQTIPEGSYVIKTLEDPLVTIGFNPQKNKKYTIEFYVTTDTISVARVKEP
jgi:hypothetical protein